MENIRRYFLALILTGILPAIHSKAQSNMMNFQLSGDGLLLSVKYERKVLPNFDLWLNGGFGLYYQSGKPYFSLPLGVRYWQPLSKNKRNYIGAGTSVTYCKAEVKLYAIIDYFDEQSRPENNYLNYIPSVGFRHLDAKGKKVYTWEACLVANNFAVLPYVGFSIGFTF